MAAVVLDVENLASFEEHLTVAGSGLLVVHFAAAWAPQCQQMREVLVELSKEDELRNVRFLQVEAESLADLSQKYEIAAVPTFVLIKNKKVVEKINGANAPNLTKAVRAHGTVTSEDIPLLKPNVGSPSEDLNVRLKRLINAAPCVVFMKGTPHEPKCGFSKQIVSIFDDLNTNYSSFNILTDDVVRQGLKEYSKWPTYPQVYVKGELIGGLDIIKELKESGELASMLPRKVPLEERIKSLINKSPVMVFMKGNSSTPRCGFSKQLVSILNDTSVAYDTVDILEDEELRQGLKTYSNWPTYPQIYVKGEFVGGLDIIKELQESGELLGTLQP